MLGMAIGPQGGLVVRQWLESAPQAVGKPWVGWEEPTGLSLSSDSLRRRGFPWGAQRENSRLLETV
jgi:hypothetical protein